MTSASRDGMTSAAGFSSVSQRSASAGFRQPSGGKLRLSSKVARFTRPSSRKRVKLHTGSTATPSRVVASSCSLAEGAVTGGCRCLSSSFFEGSYAIAARTVARIFSIAVFRFSSALRAQYSG